MSRLSDFDIIQNVAVGACALWAFSEEFGRTHIDRTGPTLPLIMPVLPMVFHRDTLLATARKQFNGGLFRAVSEDRSITAGLQRRMEAMAERTLQSLDLAYASGLLTYSPNTQEILSQRRGLPSELTATVDPVVIASARRLGSWFSTTNVEQLCIVLNITF